jgi:2-polyprenyl-6-methoxyphenol hydroxylase-like FAD-dependent oxidoreductase
VSVQAQLLVAADGYFSRVRRQCLDDGPPQVGGAGQGGAGGGVIEGLGGAVGVALHREDVFW